MSAPAPRRRGRSIAAVLAGLVAIFALSLGTDVAMHAAGVFPPWGRPMSDGLFALATVYRVVYGVLGCWIAARLAPGRPMRHALALGALGVALSAAGAAATWNRAELGPHWYPLALVAVSLPCAWVGGRLAGARARGEAAQGAAAPGLREVRRVPSLVFLPGAVGSAAFWRPVAERLADLGELHLFGYPGFGDVAPDPGVRSLGDLFEWLVARLPPGPSHVIAQSMGGVLAARLALERPERVARLVLVATSGGVDVSRLGAADWRPAFRASRPDVPGWFLDDRTDLTGRLGGIRAPTLLLCGDADPVSPPAVARFLAQRIPGARVVTVAGGTHAFANERPDEVAPVVRAHLAAASP